ncbi:hypothetical protein MSHO_60950 [Mycobacterium shottsii]|uniref:Uncharacterized protein n=1 Tax=Mycobacterium shottsii TaxID=133549 RepID=A0A7I7LMC8_9MYCO|nr:hypothetical protein MSHO_60950 [Mycobacterium shottsii]
MLSAASSTCPGVKPGAGRTVLTFSRFSLSVPVLSKHTTFNRASASIEWALRISTDSPVSRRAAASWASVTTSVKPSGTAATTRVTALATASRSGVPRDMLSSPTRPPLATLNGHARRVIRLNCRCRPISRDLRGAIASARRISECEPTAVTTATAVPATIVVPA